MKCWVCRKEILDTEKRLIIMTNGHRFGWHKDCLPKCDLYKKWMQGTIELKSLPKKLMARGPEYVSLIN